MRTLAGPGLLAVALVLPLVGCSEGEYDGAIVATYDAWRPPATYVFGGSECTAIHLGNSHDIISKPSREFYATYSVSDGGEFYVAVYIQPEGVSPDFVVTTENGELAREWTFTPDTFRDEDEFLIEEIETHHGDLIWASFWGADTDCTQLDPPAGYEPPLMP